MSKDYVKGLGVLVVLTILIAPAMYIYLKQDNYYTSQRQISDAEIIQQSDRNRKTLCNTIVKEQKTYGYSTEEIKVNESYVKYNCNVL